MSKQDGVNFSISVDAKGYEKVLVRLPKVVEQALYLMGTLAVEGAVRSISGQITPDNLAVDTGRLRASLSFITENEQGTSGQTSPNSQPDDELSGSGEKDYVIVGSNVNYAEYVHNGTSRMPGRPFLREGIDNKKEKMQEKVTELFKEALKEMK